MSFRFLHIPLLVLAAGLDGASGSADRHWFSPLRVSQSRNAEIEIREASPHRLILRIECPGFYIRDRSIFSGQYSDLELAGEGFSHKPGAPRLPVISRLLRIPAGAGVSFEILDYNEVFHTLSELGIERPILPAPPPQPVDGKAFEAVFEMDARAYAAQRCTPAEWITVSEPIRARGHELVRLQIHPVQYNPAEGVIRFVSRLELGLSFSSAAAQPEPGTKASAEFDRLMARSVLNYKPAAAGGDPPLYLVIAPSEFEGTLEPLLRWKREKGYEVVFASLYDIGPDALSIREYVRGAYTGWRTAPTYLLLVGDSDRIPPFEGRRALNPRAPHITDLFYSTMDGDDDLFPDLLAGRFPARDLYQLEPMVAKTLQYEKLAGNDAEWLERAAFVATSDPVYHELVERGHRNSIYSQFVPRGVSCDSIWTFYGGSDADFSAAVNRGTACVTYSGHGSPVSWDDLNRFNLVHIYALGNADQYPLVLSYGCSAADFSEVECLGESWLRAGGAGGALFWGATALTFWYEDYYLQQQFFQRLAGPESGSVGEITRSALLDLYRRGYPLWDYYGEIYNVLGDPSLLPWLGRPGALRVSHPDTLAHGAEQFSVAVDGSAGPVDGARVALSLNGEMLGSALSRSGSAQLELNRSVDGGDRPLLTVTRSGYRPFQAVLSVPAAPKLTFSPDSLPVGQSTLVLIDAEDEAGEPLSGLRLSFSAIGVDTASCFTGESGRAQITLFSQYGPQLEVSGREAGRRRDSFYHQLPVSGAADFEFYQVRASAPEIGAEDALVPGWNGRIEVQSQPPAELIHVRGCGTDTMAQSTSVVIAPDAEGDITVSFARAGYNTAASSVPVRRLYGTLNGRVTDLESGAGLNDVELRLLTDPVRATRTDSSGGYSFQQAMDAGYQHIILSAPGYRELSDSVLIRSGLNIRNFALQRRTPASVCGRVELAGRDRHDGAVITVIGQEARDTTDVTGAFALPAVQPGTLYLRAHKDGFSGAEKMLAADDGERLTGVLLQMLPGLDEVKEDFEGHSGPFSAAGLWQWGEPAPGLYQRGPDRPHSGEKVWATILDGDYRPNANSVLESAEISLVGFEHPRLTFYHYYQMDHFNSGFDGGNVKISIDNGVTWNLLHPLGGYPCEALSGGNAALAGEPAFSGFIEGWQRVEMDLSEYNDSQVKIRFHFGSTGEVEDAGWYIDDFHVLEREDSHADNGMEPDSPDFRLLRSYPNPFNSSTRISFQIPESGWIELRIYNSIGQLSRSIALYLDKGVHQLLWDGVDNGGNPVSSGVYLYTINYTGALHSGKMLLMR